MKSMKLFYLEIVLKVNQFHIHGSVSNPLQRVMKIHDQDRRLIYNFHSFSVTPAIIWQTKVVLLNE